MKNPNKNSMRNSANYSTSISSFFSRKSYLCSRVRGRTGFVFWILLTAGFCQFSWSECFAIERPKLVLFLVIDQFRADYLTRFENQFLSANLPKGDVGGFRYLMQNSAYFPQGQYRTLQSITAPGHATMLTGAPPYQTGIPLNEWYVEGKKTYCTEDQNSPLIGSAGLKDPKTSVGMSPRNLIATTVGDELKNAGFPSQVVSVAVKHRAAILLGGHRSDISLWYDFDSNEWVSSQYYLPEKKLPQWVLSLNQELKSEAGQKATWKSLSNGTGPTEGLPHQLVTKEPEYVKGTTESMGTPYGLEITVRAAEKSLNALKLGQGKSTDVLAVSFSSHDIVGHANGPNSPQMEEMTLAEDRLISRLLNQVRKKVPGGLKNVVVVLTGDHGVSPSPEWAQTKKLDAGRVDEDELAKQVSAHLDQKFGKPNQGDWILAHTAFNFYLNHPAILEKKLDLEFVEQEVKTILLQNPHAAYVITSNEILAKKLPPGIFETQALNTYFPKRSGDVLFVPRPFYFPGGKDSKPGSTSHSTGYAYDRTVPIVLSGFHIRKGIYPVQIGVVDIAPTLAFLNGTVPPSLSEGRILTEIIAP